MLKISVYIALSIDGYIARLSRNEVTQDVYCTCLDRMSKACRLGSKKGSYFLAIALQDSQFRVHSTLLLEESLD